MRAHLLNSMFPSFLLFVEAALHTYYDNTGFLKEHDAYLREGALKFDSEILKSRDLLDRLSRPGSSS